MNKDELVLKRNRGRPRASSNEHVMQRLQDAIELLLRDHNYHDLTEREIAAVADVDHRMIHYYFDDKEGLLFAVIVLYWDGVREKLKALDTIDPMSPSITRGICKIMIEAYYAKPWIARIVISEVMRTRSNIKDRFLKKYEKPGKMMNLLPPVFERFIEHGAYDRQLNVTYAALSIFSIMVAPLVLAGYQGDDVIAFDVLKKDDWIDFIADLFDRKFRAIEAK